MSEQSQPSVEIAPTVLISNSDNGNDNEQHSSSASDAGNSDNGEGSHSSDEPAQSIGDGVSGTASEQVTIAAIEAERDVALAEIHSDVERERIALEAERIEVIADSNEDLNKCREEIAALTAKVEALENLLIQPPQLAVVETVEELPINSETDLIQPSTAAPTASTQTEVSEESADERAEELIPNRVRKLIAI